MKKSLTYKGVPLVYSVEGEGPVIVLLHGYLESKAIWDPFVPLLKTKRKVICMDLPGHGESGTWGKEHGMKELAVAVKQVIEAEQCSGFFLVGHSMGGYVTMAFAGLFRELLSGYCLFHSTCFPDTEEKKLNREREISLVLCNKKQQIISVNIPKAFANDNVGSLQEEVDRAREIALANSDEGIVALLNGMKNREDTSQILADPGLPLLLVEGRKDNYIPGEVYGKLAGLAPHARVLILENSGHMGFIEEADAAAAALLEFG